MSSLKARKEKKDKKESGAKSSQKTAKKIDKAGISGGWILWIYSAGSSLIMPEILLPLDI